MLPHRADPLRQLQRVVQHELHPYPKHRLGQPGQLVNKRLRVPRVRRPLVPHHRLVQQLCRLRPAGFRDQAPFGGNFLRLKPIVILGGADARLNIATMLGDAGGGVPNMVLQILNMRLGRLVELLLRGGSGLF